tara:strand:+ start:110 stop:328 length:219 start_codon:yes stop_codon:yes gene_type:complete
LLGVVGKVDIHPQVMDLVEQVVVVLHTSLMYIWVVQFILLLLVVEVLGQISLTTQIKVLTHPLEILATHITC